MAGEQLTRRRFLQGLGGVAVGSAVMAGASDLSRATSHDGESWPQFGYDDGNTGHAPDNTAPFVINQELWSVDTESEADSSPAVVDGTVYLGSGVGTVYGLDATDGTEQWSFQTDEEVSSSPAVVDGTVYVGSNDTNVYALDAADGTEEWSFQTGGQVLSSPAVVDGTVYVGSTDRYVYAVNAEDGTEEWSFQTGDPVGRSSPAVVGGTVYVGSYDTNVYALDAEDGTEEWSFQTGPSAEVDSSPAVVDGTVYTGSDARMYALDAEDGTEQWSFDEAVKSSPAVMDGTVYVGSDNVYALDAEDGSEQWSFDSSYRAKSPVVVDGTVYVGDGERDPDTSHNECSECYGTVYALDATDGSKQWAFLIESGVASSPAVVAGTVYVRTVQGKTYALTEDRVSIRSTPTSTPTITDTPSQGTPGFGIGTALMGIGSGAYLLKRRLDLRDGEQ